MPNWLRIAVVAGLLSVAGLPAGAAEMPAYGTKNFTPGGDTPAYFTHNVAAPTVRSEDWSAADQAAGPAEPAEAPAHAAGPTTRRHGKVAANHRGASHTAGKSAGTSKGKSRSTRLAAAKPGKTARTASPAHARHATTQMSAAKTRSTAHAGHAVRHAAVKSSQRKG